MICYNDDKHSTLQMKILIIFRYNHLDNLRLFLETDIHLLPILYDSKSYPVLQSMSFISFVMPLPNILKTDSFLVHNL